MDTDESDITLGPGKLLGLFFMLVAVCGVFFAIGYSLGKTSAREQAMNDKTALNASLSAPSVGDPSVAKPSAVVSAKNEPQAAAPDEQSAANSQPDMTFYNAVKKVDRGSQSASTDGAQPAGSKAQPQPGADSRATTDTKPVQDAKTEAKGEVKPTVAPVAGGAFVVQIAAVSREEDAAALAGALRKKSYSVFVVNNPAIHDKLYHVQVGPFATLQDAETMKLKLTGEGYNPIVKRS
ncbi:MAG TPA: SPOR domain-containing protein [Terriglobales bacterium]